MVLTLQLLRQETPATVVDSLQDVNLKLPAVLMNGVLLYDIKEEKVY